jgi:hypothetical protein
MMFLMGLRLACDHQVAILPIKAVGLEVVHDTGHG